MKPKRLEANLRMTLAVFAAIVGLMAMPMAVMAQDAESYFDNPAQAQKAENLAAASAEDAQTALGQAESNLETAEGAAATADTAIEGITAAINDGVPEADQLSPEQLATTAVDDPDAALQSIVETINAGLDSDAEPIDVNDLTAAPEDYGLTADQLAEVQNYSTTQSNLSQAQTDFESALANVSGVSVAEIAEMRAADMGWGVIAHTLGVHPSVLGNKYGHQVREREKSAHAFGHGKKAGMVSMSRAARARDMRTGGAKNFGQAKAGKGIGAGNAGGLGKSNGKSNKGGKANSGSRGNSGNNGSGRGGGQGNGKNK